VITYAPEKTATAACLDADGRITSYVKVAAAGQALRDCGYYDAVRSSLAPDDPYLAVPEPLAFSAAHRMLWLEAIPGHRPGTDEMTATADFQRMGAGVARFHAFVVREAPPFTRFDVTHLVNAARILAAIRPDLQTVAHALSARLIDSAVVPGESVCLHGDLDPKNSVVCDQRIGLFDLEDRASGPAAADIGTLVSALEYARAVEAVAPSVISERRAGFLDGYAAVSPLPDTQSLAWHTAASLFVDRATRAVTRIRPVGLEQLPVLLDRASAILTEGIDA
jgi:Ser/Thr protein kinase RdoA (MazF antagonist)